MDKQIRRIGILTSGGDAPGMNALIRSVVRTASAFDISVLGIRRGYSGLINGDIIEMGARSVDGIIRRGGTMLYTARCKEMLTEEGLQKAADTCKYLGIDGLICCGGDGTFRGAQALSRKGVPCIGVPGTIDNDLAYTDYTIGFDTALNTACECLNKIRETSDSHERASMLTVMGRNCGDIALHTALTCGAEICMIPEIPWDIIDVAERVKWGVLRGKRSMIIVFAEGALSSLTTDLEKLCAEHEELHDIVPHHNLITSSQIAMIIEKLSGHETRSTVLGYIQRGGSPSARDRLLATQLGAHAADLLAMDRGGLAVGVRGTNLIEVPFADVQKGEHTADSGLADLVDIMAVIRN